MAAKNYLSGRAGQNDSFLRTPQKAIESANTVVLADTTIIPIAECRKK